MLAACVWLHEAKITTIFRTTSILLRLGGLCGPETAGGSSDSGLDDHNSDRDSKHDDNNNLISREQRVADDGNVMTYKKVSNIKPNG